MPKFFNKNNISSDNGIEVIKKAIKNYKTYLQLKLPQAKLIDDFGDLKQRKTNGNVDRIVIENKIEVLNKLENIANSNVNLEKMINHINQALIAIVPNQKNDDGSNIRNIDLLHTHSNGKEKSLLDSLFRAIARLFNTPVSEEFTDLFNKEKINSYITPSV